eukprot:TRINITY_DN13924_c1_g1_i1.p1 TRINITY_DN13924_c1_g1~~TRINITY_DN13924_c1_g1_i1.p1  ORF type:complete len:368 (+),score=43.48 TRINITY_DN13924_c1_g1_i1:29-1132(+)
MSTAAAACTVIRGLNKDDAVTSLGELPKLPWIHLCDQQNVHKLIKVPVPKFFQRGQEHARRLTPEALHKWLSRVSGKNVTCVHIAVGMRKSLDNRRLIPFQYDSAVKMSPFVDGALVVVCCNGAALDPEVCSKLKSPSSRSPSKERASNVQSQVQSGVAKLWSSARARVHASRAFLPIRRSSPRKAREREDAYEGDVSDAEPAQRVANGSDREQPLLLQQHRTNSNERCVQTRRNEVLAHATSTTDLECESQVLVARPKPRRYSEHSRTTTASTVSRAFMPSSFNAPESFLLGPPAIQPPEWTATSLPGHPRWAGGAAVASSARCSESDNPLFGCCRATTRPPRKGCCSTAQAEDDAEGRFDVKYVV